MRFLKTVAENPLAFLAVLAVVVVAFFIGRAMTVAKIKREAKIRRK